MKRTAQYYRRWPDCASHLKKWPTHWLGQGENSSDRPAHPTGIPSHQSLGPDSRIPLQEAGIGAGVFQPVTVPSANTAKPAESPAPIATTLDNPSGTAVPEPTTVPSLLNPIV